MTIEKEAEEIVYPENNPMDAFWKSICDEHPCIGEELESIRFRITKALHAKQDRIEELESALKECVSALEFASTKTDHMSDGYGACAVCEIIDSALDRAKKAIGGGNAGD